MNIRSMFLKSIDRDVKGVIKVGQIDEENVYEELDEYVVTKQLSRHFRDFFDAYQKSLHRPTDKMGVWISGFFGSGKSHLLKIFSYLLENRNAKGKPAVSFFKDRIEDPLVMANMEQAGGVACDVILFNIDSKSPYAVKGGKEAIIRVFAKVFYDYQGYYGDKPWVADMESALEQEGVYQDFKSVFKRLTGDEWETRRRRILFDRDDVVKALVESRGMSREAALEWFKAKDDNVVLSIENFARNVKEHIDKRGRDHRLVFLVDEMGQYISDDSQMMLSLQTIAEDLGTFCQGRVWVVVTSQEDLDSIIKGMGRGMDIDFSKIQGRFDTRLNLTSANVDEVIKRRILEKTPTAADTLRLYFKEKSAVLRNLMSFAEGTPEMKTFESKLEFAEVYPFIPYQFNLLQKVFTGIREHASSGRHLASGERSLLSAFQEAAQAYGDAQLGALVPFHEFYESIRSFLDSSVSQVIEQAETNAQLKPEDINVLKLLFMIKYVKEMPPMLDNVTTLMVNYMDQDKLALKESITASLRRLEEQTLIQKNGDAYIFLTNEEQEINREIKKMNVGHDELCKEIGDIVFDEIYTHRRYRYSNHYDFTYNQMIDDRPRGAQDGEITLQIITPDFYEDLEEHGYAAHSALQQERVLVVLPKNKRAFLEELEAVLQIEAYQMRSGSVQNTPAVQEIMSAKTVERQERRNRASTLLVDALGDAQIYVRGDRLDLRTRNPKEKFEQALKRLVENIYLKLGYIEDFVTTTAELQTMMTEDKAQLSLTVDVPNRLALEEVERFVERRDLMNRRVDMKSLLDHFKRAPYGWNELDIAALVARLAWLQKIRLQYGGENLSITDRRIPDYLTKRGEVERLVMRRRIGVEPALINTVRNIGHTVFNYASLPSDEDHLARKMTELINVEKTLAEQLLKYYKDPNGAKYPGKDGVTEAKDLLKRLLTSSEPALLFEALDKNREELKLGVKRLELMSGFFDGQRSHFDQALSVLDCYYDNRQHIADPDIQDIVEQIKDIVAEDEPYSDIHKLPSLLQRFNEAFANHLEKACYPIRDVIRKDYESVREEAIDYGFSEKFMSDITRPFKELMEQIEEADDFNKAYAMESTSKKRRKQAWKHIDEEKERLERAKEDVLVNPLPPVSKERIELGPHEIFGGRIVLKNIEDLDKFLEELKASLSKHLGGDKEVRIIW